MRKKGFEIEIPPTSLGLAVRVFGTPRAVQKFVNQLKLTYNVISISREYINHDSKTVRVYVHIMED